VRRWETLINRILYGYNSIVSYLYAHVWKRNSGRINGNVMPENVAKKREIEIGNF
jgi:hypothetical protein